MKFIPEQKVRFIGFSPGGCIRPRKLVKGNIYTVKKYGQPKDGKPFLQLEEDQDWFYDEEIFESV